MGCTQNPNESLHSKLWTKFSKTKFAGLNRVNFLAKTNILDHNFVYRNISLLMHLGFGASENTLAGLDVQEKKRKSPKEKKVTKKKKQEASTEHYSSRDF